MARPETPAEPPTRNHGGAAVDAPAGLTGPSTAAPDAAVELAARAAHRSQFANPKVEAMVWTGATPAYRQRWHHIAQAALDAAAGHLANLAAQHRQQAGHNGDQTAGLDWAAHHLRHEPGS